MLSSINDLLSSDILFRIFKYLDCVEIVVVRRTCKQWFAIIDEHKSFWRNLHLEYFPYEWTPSIIDLYNKKCQSTLEEVDIAARIESKFEDHLVNVLQESRETLKHLSFTFSNPKETCISQTLLQTHQNLISLRTYSLRTFVHTKRLRPINGISDQEGSPLKILWTDVQPAILQLDLPRYQNLVSLSLSSFSPHLELRKLLDGPSKSLKHLSLALLSTEETGKEIDPLSFPRLEVCEFSHSSNIDQHNSFPKWLVIPTSARLICHSYQVENLPSVEELWLFEFRFFQDVITSQVPEMTTLCIITPELSEKRLGSLTNLLERRKANVEAGLEFDGIRLKMIKTLILRISSERREGEGLGRLKQFVGEVIDRRIRDLVVEVEVEF